MNLGPLAAALSIWATQATCLSTVDALHSSLCLLSGRFGEHLCSLVGSLTSFPFDRSLVLGFVPRNIFAVTQRILALAGIFGCWVDANDKVERRLAQDANLGEHIKVAILERNGLVSLGLHKGLKHAH